MDNNVPAPAPRFNIAATLGLWRKEIRAALGALDAQIDRLGQLERKIQMLIDLCPPQSLGDDASIIFGADPIAYNMDVDYRSDGYIVVALDGGKRFKLPPQLAEVFLFISSAEKEHDSRDPLVGWRTRADILELVARSARRTFPRRYVNNLVHRLKQALRQAGYNNGLIQTHRRKGVRLAYKRSSHGVPDPGAG
ncbi:MAG: hypothetical protein ACLQHF_07670 [Terracidiphilus sp.]